MALSPFVWKSETDLSFLPPSLSFLPPSGILHFKRRTMVVENERDIVRSDDDVDGVRPSFKHELKHKHCGAPPTEDDGEIEQCGNHVCHIWRYRNSNKIDIFVRSNKCWRVSSDCLPHTSFTIHSPSEDIFGRTHGMTFYVQLLEPCHYEGSFGHLVPWQIREL